MVEYLLSDLAISDLADIRHHIAVDNQEAAERVIAGFFSRFNMIAQQPEIGAIWTAFTSSGLRVHSVGNYAIFYRVQGDTVQIARVLHGARDLHDLLG